MSFFSRSGGTVGTTVATFVVTSLLTAANLVVSGAFTLSAQPEGRILYTESGGVATTTPSLAYASTTQTLTVPKASLTNTTSTSLYLSGLGQLATMTFTHSTGTSGHFTTLCLTGDTCITAWPTGGGGGTDGNWIYNNTSAHIYPATTTNDILFGASASASAPFYFDYVSPSSSVQIGRVGNANLFVGTSTYGGGLNAGYSLNGDDVFIQSNLGLLGSLWVGGTVSSTGLNVNTATLASATISGKSVCLADGTNCPASTGGSQTLAQVTALGSYATTTLQFYGGFISSSSTVTSSLDIVTGKNITYGGANPKRTLSLSGASALVASTSPRPTSTVLTIGTIPHLFYAFNATNTNCMYWMPGTLPSSWDASTLSPVITWTAPTGTSGVVVWRLKAQSLADDTWIGDSIGGTASYATATVGTYGYFRSVDAMSTLTVGGAAKDIPVRFELCREGANAGDTFGNDAYAEIVVAEYGVDVFGD